MLISMNFDNLVLRPNCLLTKSPLVFVPGPRSLFHYQNSYGMLPRFLFEHGYVTSTLSLPFRGSNARKAAFKKWLSLSAGKLHLIMDQLVYDELKAELSTQRIQSITVISSIESELSCETFKITEKPLTTANYALHRILNWVLQTETPPFERTFLRFNQLTYDRFLDHCVKLAENEIYA